jgi:SM-20-related protein
MPTADFFARRGLFVIERFFDPDSCRRVCAEIRSAATGPGTVERQGDYMVDETTLKAQRAEVSAQTYAHIGQSLADLRPKLADHFTLELTRCESPAFAVYRPGDFVAPHTDVATSLSSPEHLRARKVAVVLFLNGESDEPAADSYGPGSLTFFGLIDEPPWRSMGFPVAGHAGLLIGFPAGMVHSVTPVTHGERYTVVTRFA